MADKPGYKAKDVLVFEGHFAGKRRQITLEAGERVVPKDDWTEEAFAYLASVGQLEPANVTKTTKEVSSAKPAEPPKEE